MIFEKEILRDYSRFVKYVKHVRAKFMKALYLNRNTTEVDDFINDAIIDFYESSPVDYKPEAIERIISRHMQREYRYVDTKSVEIKPYQYEVLQAQEVPIVNNYDFRFDDVEDTQAFLKSGIVTSSAECNYYVLNDGRVISHMTSNNRFKLLRPAMQHGYIVFFMGLDERNKTRIMYAHRMVFQKYGGDIPRCMDVRHIDGDKLNNHISNLGLLPHRDAYDKIRKPKRPPRKIGAPFGSRHGKFKGIYFVNGVGYESSYLAEKSTGINYRTLQRWCKLNKEGFSFEPAC